MPTLCPELDLLCPRPKDLMIGSTGDVTRRGNDRQGSLGIRKRNRKNMRSLASSSKPFYSRRRSTDIGVHINSCLRKQIILVGPTYATFSLQLCLHQVTGPRIIPCCSLLYGSPDDACTLRTRNPSVQQTSPPSCIMRGRGRKTATLVEGQK